MIRLFNEEPLSKRSSGSKKINPFNKKKPRMTEYDAGWKNSCGSDENIVLYYIFLILSYMVDWAKGIKITKDADGKLTIPKTNLRLFAKSSNIVIIVLLLAIGYYLVL